MSRTVTVVRPGALTTVQDLGRPGFAHLGVGRSGACDEPALRLANRLVGNPEPAAGLETTLDGVALRFLADAYAAVTGAPAPVRVDGRPAPWAAGFGVRAGSVVEIGPASAGVRSYLAISGAIAVPETLGSRASDVLSGLGPAPLRAGDELALGAPGEPPPPVGFAPFPAPEDELVVRCLLGPREDWLLTAGRAALGRTAWVVQSASNRIALRLGGPALALRRGELPSEGLVLGAVQVPPSGEPLVFLADHPVTGGYPVIGVVPEPDVWRLGQARPGARIRFLPRHGGHARRSGQAP
ncbi:MAG: biotin-dependent carboxyltransferase family protein [Actinomycetota bacterium]|nr:biotin-dependent carboxyltransferase family protein [Actinomycetota bacterium]